MPAPPRRQPARIWGGRPCRSENRPSKGLVRAKVITWLERKTPHLPGAQPGAHRVQGQEDLEGAVGEQHAGLGRAGGQDLAVGNDGPEPRPGLGPIQGLGSRGPGLGQGEGHAQNQHPGQTTDQVDRPKAGLRFQCEPGQQASPRPGAPGSGPAGWRWRTSPSSRPGHRETGPPPGPGPRARTPRWPAVVKAHQAQLPHIAHRQVQERRAGEHQGRDQQHGPPAQPVGEQAGGQAHQHPGEGRNRGHRPHPDRVRAQVGGQQGQNRALGDGRTEDPQESGSAQQDQGADPSHAAPP